jgi:hypothetical protein
VLNPVGCERHSSAIVAEDREVEQSFALAVAKPVQNPVFEIKMASESFQCGRSFKLRIDFLLNKGRR